MRSGFERVKNGYGNRIVSVLHLAAYYDFSGEPSDKYETITVQGTERLLLDNQEWKTREISKALAKTGAWMEDHMPFKDAFIKPWIIDLADDHYALDSSRAQKVLGWKQTHSLRETLPKMVEALKADPEHEGGHEEHGAMPEMTRDMRKPWLWTNFTIISLGLWLMSSPFTFGYASRGMIWSDVISGALLVFFSILQATPDSQRRF